MDEFLTFNATWPWPWIRPIGTPSCITHRPLITHQISFESEKFFVDGRTSRAESTQKQSKLQSTGYTASPSLRLMHRAVNTWYTWHRGHTHTQHDTEHHNTFTRWVAAKVMIWLTSATLCYCSANSGVFLHKFTFSSTTCLTVYSFTTHFMTTEFGELF